MKICRGKPCVFCVTILKHDFDDYKDLLSKRRRSTWNVRRSSTLYVDVYETLNDLNQRFMNNIFKSKTNGWEVRGKYKLNLDIPKWNQKSFGSKSLKLLGPQIWSNLPYHVKSSENLNVFKNLLKNWNENSYKCNLCEKMKFIKIFHSQYYLFSLFLLYIGRFLLNIIHIKSFF